MCDHATQKTCDQINNFSIHFRSCFWCFLFIYLWQCEWIIRVIDCEAFVIHRLSSILIIQYVSRFVFAVSLKRFIKIDTTLTFDRMIWWMRKTDSKMHAMIRKSWQRICINASIENKKYLMKFYFEQIDF